MRLRRLGGALAALTALWCATAPAQGQVPNQQPNQEYVAMGDSYSSGNGASPYYDESCYRSNSSYGPLIRQEFLSGRTFSHPACSGARTPHIVSSSQNGFPKQIDLLGENTKYVTISIGGNDAGFTDALGECANPFGNCSQRIDQAEAYIQNTLPGILDSTYAKIRERAPKAVVTVVGYPRIFKPSSSCNVVFSSGEVDQANAAADLLAEVTRDRALAAGFSYVDSRWAFLGHGACDDEWINGVMFSDTSGSYHPNPSGYQAFKRLAGTTLLAARNPEQPTSPNGRVAFVSSRDGAARVYAMNANGDFPQPATQGATFPAPATNPAVTEASPAWSPDGSKLAFASDRDGDHEIYVLDWASRSVQKLTNNTAADVDPAWSPNGDWIAFRRGGPSDGDIWRVRAGGGSEANLTDFTSDSHVDSAPAWSPDGSEIAFRRSTSGANGEVMRMSSNGEGQVNLTSNSADDGAPAWSPDGRTIAFESNRTESNYDVYTMTRAGASVARRTTDPAADRDPAYAPSGSAIVFTSARNGNDEVYTATVTGASQTRRTSVAGADLAPSWQGDGDPPQVTINSGPTGLTTQRQPAFGFTSDEPGSTFQCRLDGGGWSSCASPHTTPLLADGDHSFAVRAIDPSGNVSQSEAQRDFEVDATSGTTITSAPAGITSDRAPELTFESSIPGATFECSMDGAEFTACESPHETSELSDGEHVFAVRGVAPGGEVGAPVEARFTVDATAPESAIDFAPATLGNDPRPRFEFSSNEAGSAFECKLDSGGWDDCTSPYEAGQLADGSHSFAVRATDAAGNVESQPETFPFEIDTEAPGTEFGEVPERVTERSLSISFGSDDPAAAFECRFDSGDEAAWLPCDSPWDSPQLADGSHVLEVRAHDPAGNVEAPGARAEFAVDATAPDTYIDSPPVGLTNRKRPRLVFSSDDPDATFECRLAAPASIDATEWAACAETGDLNDGDYVFEVRAVDGFGTRDPSPAREEFSVDATKPPPPVIAGPAGFAGVKVTTDRTPDFTLTGENLECRLDAPSPASPWSSCPESYTTPQLTAGAHKLEARSRDEAGNYSDVSTWAFTVDVTPPAVTGLSLNVPPVTTSRSAQVKFASSEADHARFRCRLDGGEWAPCTSPWALSDLADGPHTAAVVAIDPAGNETQTPASTTFTVDAPPETTITAGPTGTVREARPAFRFEADQPGTFECRIDGEAFKSCRSGDAFGPLSDGPHTFQVRAVDQLNNRDQSPAGRPFVVDTGVAAPVVEVPKKLKAAKGKVSIPVTVSAGEATSVSATGTVAVGSAQVPLPAKSLALLARARGGLKLAPATSGAKALKRALKKPKPLIATITVEFADVLGNTTSVQRTVKLVGKRKKR